MPGWFAELKVVVGDIGVPVLVDLREVVSLDGVTEFMQELDEFGGGVTGELGRQTYQR